jgi:predicted  nucleic acid-binding Zn-ribbon protein
MSLEIHNCKRCNKIFRKATRDICQNCLDVEQDHFKAVYKLLNKSSQTGGVTMQEISESIGIRSEEVDEILRNYGFGTAMDYLKVPCTTCGTVIMGSHRRGKFCLHCSNQVAEEAGVTIQSKDQLEEKDSAERHLKENLAKQFRESAAANAKRNEDSGPKYGLKRSL